ncbi:transposase IS4 [Nitzschia inconspicua]|uniref:Transposase IS4 n=1 Tax=Nitzschia inconspicua TaxID=303405 RepID=A0A9K3KYX5_9STRA|nr:transposase IS4 [Nitzschia inconspicua]
MEQCYHKEPNGKAGFSEDINKKIQSDKESSENNSTYKSFFGVDWQVPVLDSVHFREDHENDTPCQRGFLSRDREGTLRTWPWTAHPFIAAQTGLINRVPVIGGAPYKLTNSLCVCVCAHNKIKTMEESDDSSAFSELFEFQYDPITPFITHLNTDDEYPEQMDPYTPIFGSEREDFDPKFQIPNGVDATVSSVLELFLPDSLLDRWVSATNAYAESRLSRKRCKRVSRSHILRFISTLMFMGVVQLRCKEDYFVDKDDPDSDFFEHYRRIKLSYSMFRYLWRNFHTSFQPTDLDDIVNDGADEADDSFFDDETVDEQEEHLEDVEQEDEVEMPHW